MTIEFVGLRDELAFLDAWKRGVTIAGPRFFGDGTGIGARKWDLAPRIDDIEKYIGQLSSTEATFLAAMVSFYNAKIGGRWLATMNYKVYGLADIAGSLEPQQRRVIAELLLSYPGW